MKKLVLYENSYLDSVQEICEFIVLNVCYGSSLLFSLLSLLFKGSFYKLNSSIVFGGNFILLFIQVILTVCLLFIGNAHMVDLLFGLKKRGYWSVELSKFGFIKKYNDFINRVVSFSFIVNMMFLSFIAYYDGKATKLYHLSSVECNPVLLENLHTANLVLRLLFFVVAIAELLVFLNDWTSRHKQREIIFEFPLNVQPEQNFIKIVKNDSSERTLDLDKEVVKFVQGTVFVLEEKSDIVKTIYPSEEIRKIVLQCQDRQDDLVYDNESAKWHCHAVMN